MTPPRPPFVLLKFAAAGALVLAACVLGAQAAAHAPAPLAGPAAVAIALGGAAAMTAAFWWLLLPLAGVREGMATAAREVAAREVFAQAQNSLEANMNMLRASIYALGEPRRRGEELRFGHTLINDNFEIVDAVKRAYGGVATVFLGDVRVATNVVAADGKRAVGTRLAAGKVRDRVLGEGKTFRGPADILGVPHLTIYEPILSGGETVGVLFIGIRAAEAAAQDLAAPRDEFADMRRTLALFNASSQARQEADQQADVLRQEADDARRAHEAARQTAARSQQQVVDAMSQGLEQLSRSRLDHRLEGPFPAEYAKLKTDFNAALAALADVMSRITDGAGVMGRGVGEIADAVGDLSRRTEQQAATLQQTAAALDQITVTVEKTAEGAVSVRDAAASAKEEAEGSAEVMREAVSAMTEIEQASHRIGAIIGLIDEIALQTSLLALNAGIEASRAGDAGRGFSVVAAEVRVLAQRTTEAARDVKTLISASSTRVAQGKGLVDEGGAALERIRGQVADIHAVTVGIAASAREQSSALAQINGAINQMDHVTRQNAAMAEETTAASQELTSGAEDLLGLVGAFRLAAQTTEAARPSRPMRAAA